MERLRIHTTKRQVVVLNTMAMVAVAAVAAIGGQGNARPAEAWPEGVKRMSLQNVCVFGRVFSIVVDGSDVRVVENKK